MTIERESIELAFDLVVQEKGISHLIELKAKNFRDYDKNVVNQHIYKLKADLAAIKEEHLRTKLIVSDTVSEIADYQLQHDKTSSKNLIEYQDQAKTTEIKAEYLRAEIQEMALAKINDSLLSRYQTS